MGLPSQKKPEGAVVWEAPGRPPEFIITHEPDGEYGPEQFVVWEWRPDMIKYGYTTGYAGRGGGDTKREAVQLAKESIKMNRKQKVNRLADLLKYAHAKKKKPSAQLQREIDEALAKRS